MNSQRVTKELAEKYPNKLVFKNNEEHPTEIICEVEPTSEHLNFSTAIAVIDRSIPHVHLKATETYKVLRGTLTVYINGQATVLHQGDTLTIHPNQVHWAEGDEVWVECLSKPGWTAEDHVVVGDS